jgi:hypothetical protein
MRLIHVPVRKTTRFPVNLSLQGGLRSGVAFAARVVNLSVHGVCSSAGIRSAWARTCGSPSTCRTATAWSRPTAPSCGRRTRTASGSSSPTWRGDGRVRIKRYVEAV